MIDNVNNGFMLRKVFTYPDILHTGKKVRLQIHIDHKMFEMFTSRNVKKNLFISQLSHLVNHVLISPYRSF
jgi:hypothetical protein